MEAGLHAAASAESVGSRGSSLRDKLLKDISAAVKAVIADAEAYTRQAVDEARQQSEIAVQELQRKLAAALGDLEKERDDTRALKHDLAVERAAKERAEASYAAAQATQHQVAAGFAERIRVLELELEPARREASRLANELEIESAERRRLSAVLESIRSAVGAAPPASPVEPVKASHSTAPDVPSAAAAVEASDHEEEEKRTVSAKDSTSSTSPHLTVVVRTEVERDSTLSDCARQLLDQVEESYQSDVESLQRPFEVVDRLVIQLRTARELFLSQCNNDETLATEEFDRQISHLVDTKGATNFGRHLGIAWYEISHPAERVVAHAVA